MVGQLFNDRLRCVVRGLKCPLCGKDMTAMKEKEGHDSHSTLYYCSKHGTMNKSTDLKEKADQIAEKA